MKSIKNNSIVLLLLLGIAIAQGQTNKEKRANIKYENLDYQDAINSYQELIDDGLVNQEILQNIGNANYLNANYEQAAKWYQQLTATYADNITPEYLYRYAQSLKSLQQYKESDTWMQRYSEASNDKRASLFKTNEDYLKRIKENSGNFELKLEDFNSKYSDFAPSYRGEYLVFSSNRDTGIVSKNVHKWNKSSFLNLYQTGATDSVSSAVKKLAKGFNTKAHESSTAYSKDGNTVYFTRNNFGTSFKRDQNGVSRLKIFKAELVDGQWKKEKELPFNSSEYSVAHPTLNDKEDRLYFSSDMPGTLGNSDIFYVTINEDGSYGEPVNLGGTVNTEARETFPFIHQEVLYFASDGHPGLGGLDIFATTIATDEPEAPKNLGVPLNSDEDDFSLILNNTTKTGFLASNRANGLGDDDIYSFSFKEEPLKASCEKDITGIVKDKNTSLPLAGAAVEIIGSNGQILATTSADAKGGFATTVDCTDQDLTIVATKEGHSDDKSTFTIDADATNKPLVLQLKKIVKEVERGDDLSNYLEIPIIYFDLDKSFIKTDAKLELDKVVAYMKQYPKVKVAIGSHTDSRASDGYNISLSQRRANATKAYLITKGIAANRLTAKGYGETKLRNNCSNGVACSDAQHEFNRRSEFIVIDK